MQLHFPAAPDELHNPPEPNPLALICKTQKKKSFDYDGNSTLSFAWQAFQFKLLFANYSRTYFEEKNIIGRYIIH